MGSPALHDAGGAPAWWLGRGPALGFALRFAVLVSALAGLSLLPSAHALLERYLLGLARLAAGVVRCGGVACRVDGSTLWSPKYALTVGENCSGLELLAFFVAAVLAFPVAWRSKGPALLAAVPAILC